MSGSTRVGSMMFSPAIAVAMVPSGESKLAHVVSPHCCDDSSPVPGCIGMSERASVGFAWAPLLYMVRSHRCTSARILFI